MMPAAHFYRRVPVLAAAAAVFGFAIVFIEGQHRPASGLAARAPGRVEHNLPEHVASLARPRVAGSGPTWDSDFITWVEHKYRFLLVDSPLTGASRVRLLQLLREREQLAGLADAGLSGIENQLRTLLGASQYETYRLLRDSDEEQHHLGEYAGGISAVAPLTAQQERAVLVAKLVHRQAYEAVLRDSGMERETLSAAEREYAHRTLVAALKRYRDDFLQEARQSLSEEQYILLRDYETTEFRQALEALEISINAK